jgi:hypothetical protein
VISGVAMFPATRFTNTWPILWSKRISTGTRESAQASTEANGSCFSAVFWARMVRSSVKDVKRFAVKRAFPSMSALSASSGVFADCAPADRGAAQFAASPSPSATAPAAAVCRRSRRPIGIPCEFGDTFSLLLARGRLTIPAGGRGDRSSPEDRATASLTRNLALPEWTERRPSDEDIGGSSGGKAPVSGPLAAEVE